jgi:hypothetical protein
MNAIIDCSYPRRDKSLQREFFGALHYDDHPAPKIDLRFRAVQELRPGHAGRRQAQVQERI